MAEINDKIIFNKVLKKNLPGEVTPGKNHFYFTENGEMHITNQNGKLVQIGGKSGGGLISVEMKLSNREW